MADMNSRLNIPIFIESQVTTACPKLYHEGPVERQFPDISFDTQLSLRFLPQMIHFAKNRKMRKLRVVCPYPLIRQIIISFI